MKSINWLLYIAIIAITGIFIGFTSYTTNTSSKQVDTVKTTTTDTRTETAIEKFGTSKNKPCGCCAKRYALRQERIKQARARKLARETATKTSSP